MPAERVALPLARCRPTFVVGQHLQFGCTVLGQCLGHDLVALKWQAQVDGEVAALQPAHMGVGIGQAIGEADDAALEVAQHPIRN
ncbi:hypothetical protein D3C86_1730970 [compost metagenome]